MTDLTYATLHNQVLDALARDDRAPIAVRLGAAQREAVERHVRESTGQTDVGPLLSFAGLDVRSSKKADALELVWSDTPDEDEASPAAQEAEPSAN